MAAWLAGCGSAPNPQTGTLFSLDFDQVSWVAVAKVMGKSEGGQGDVLGYERITDWATLDISHRQEFASIIHDMLKTEIARNSQAGIAPEKTVGLSAIDFTPDLVVRIDTSDGVRYVFCSSTQRRLCICDKFGNSWLESLDRSAEQAIRNDIEGARPGS